MARGSSSASAQSQKRVSCSTFQITNGLTRLAVSPLGRPACLEFAGFLTISPSSSAARKIVLTQFAYLATVEVAKPLRGRFGEGGCFVPRSRPR